MLKPSRNCSVWAYRSTQLRLEGREQTGLRVLSISMPRAAYSGEEVPIDLSVQSMAAGQGRVSLSVDGKPLGDNPVMLAEGVTPVHVHARINTSGVTSIAGRITQPGGGSTEFEQAIDLNRPQVLYISEDPEKADQNLMQALGDHQVRDQARSQPAEFAS